ncbi:MAG: hypothetical protein U0795_24005 [Pirellulales bacterium]
MTGPLEELPDELLSGYLDGVLTDEERRQVEDLLQSDADARARLEELRSLQRQLRSLPRISAPPDLRSRIARQIQEVSATADPGTTLPGTTLPGGGWSRAQLWTAVLSAMAASILTLLTVPAWLNQDRSVVGKREPSVVSPSQGLKRTPSDSTRMNRRSLDGPKVESIEARQKELDGSVPPKPDSHEPSVLSIQDDKQAPSALDAENRGLDEAIRSERFSRAAEATAPEQPTTQQPTTQQPNPYKLTGPQSTAGALRASDRAKTEGAASPAGEVEPTQEFETMVVTVKVPANQLSGDAVRFSFQQAVTDNLQREVQWSDWDVTLAEASNDSRKGSTDNSLYFMRLRSLSPVAQDLAVNGPSVEGGVNLELGGERGGYGGNGYGEGRSRRGRSEDAAAGRYGGGLGGYGGAGGGADGGGYGGAGAVGGGFGGAGGNGRGSEEQSGGDVGANGALAESVDGSKDKMDALGTEVLSDRPNNQPGAPAPLASKVPGAEAAVAETPGAEAAVAETPGAQPSVHWAVVELTDVQQEQLVTELQKSLPQAQVEISTIRSELNSADTNGLSYFQQSGSVVAGRPGLAADATPSGLDRGELNTAEAEQLVQRLVLGQQTARYLNRDSWQFGSAPGVGGPAPTEAAPALPSNFDKESTAASAMPSGLPMAAPSLAPKATAEAEATAEATELKLIPEQAVAQNESLDAPSPASSAASGATELQAQRSATDPATGPSLSKSSPAGAEKSEEPIPSPAHRGQLAQQTRPSVTAKSMAAPAAPRRRVILLFEVVPTATGGEPTVPPPAAAAPASQ